MAERDLTVMDSQAQLLAEINRFIRMNDISAFSYISRKCQFDIFQTVWWNMKWYDWPNKEIRPSGNQLQTFHLKNELISEIPDERKIGYASCRRFSSSSNENSYWTNNYDLAVLESNRNNDQFGFLKAKFIKEGSEIFDLGSHTCALLKMLEKENLIENTSTFYEETLQGIRDEDIFITRNIGEAAYKKGYSGIIWQSIKVEELMKTLGGQICQRYYIVLYSDDCLSKSLQ
jgi:hypothetical protein